MPTQELLKRGALGVTEEAAGARFVCPSARLAVLKVDGALPELDWAMILVGAHTCFVAGVPWGGGSSASAAAAAGAADRRGRDAAAAPRCLLDVELRAKRRARLGKFLLLRACGAHRIWKEERRGRDDGW
jgi:hypothetical protein